MNRIQDVSVAIMLKAERRPSPRRLRELSATHMNNRAEGRTMLINRAHQFGYTLTSCSNNNHRE